MIRHNITCRLAIFVLVSLLCIFCTSCSDEIEMNVDQQSTGFSIVGNPVQATLSISVSDLSMNIATRAEDPKEYDVEDTEDERHVDDLWIFEYSQASGNLIYTPQRVSITNQSDLDKIEVTLSDNYGANVVIYVVANSGSGVEEDSKNWVAYNSTNGTYDGFMTISELEKNTIPTPHPQRMTWDESDQKYVLDSQDANNVSIPMGGSVKTKVTEGADIFVPVERMFAKVIVRVDLSDFSEDYEEAWLSTITIGNIPEYCVVKSLGDNLTTQKADYSNCERWLQRRFNAIGETSNSAESSDETIYPYIIYIPENIQGENGSTDDKGENVPSSIRSSYDTDALYVMAGIYVITLGGSTQGEYNSFVAYPGGNTTNNFNVRRNCLYRVTLKINNLIDEILPSANCIICPSGETTAFYPYCREEIGGGYKFEDYLYAYDDDKYSGQKIDHVGIIWQSTDGGNTVNYSSSATGYIGDNSTNDYVWIDDVAKGEAIDEYHRRIHVSIPDGHTGNALVGAFNEKDEIIWSWHIWSRARANDPTTVNTKLYYTYDWDSNGIYGRDSGRPRVAGYTIMNCNLGAMQDEPDNYGSYAGTAAFVLPTYGTMYQWGRKDPFPPFTYVSETANTAYNTNRVGNYFDNEDRAVTIVNTNDETALFHSVPAGEERQYGFDVMIPLTIQNPTVFYATTVEVNYQDNSKVGWDGASTALNTYYSSPHNGNWLLDNDNEHYNRLWGGLDPELDKDKISKSYNTGLSCLLGDVHVYDDYGEKSIFDPCPYGWRVSPPDLWFGFTDTGLNPVNDSGSAVYDTSHVNYKSGTSYTSAFGLTLYLTAWQEGETTFFPTSGARAPDGCLFRDGGCGNYHNATADTNDRVNIFHVHNTQAFKIFEVTYLPFYVKANASSIRCVRINSVQQ